MIASGIRDEHESSSRSSRALPELTGRWPRIAQILWLCILTLVLVVVALRIGAAMDQIHHVCSMPHCQGAELTREQVQLLERLAIPRELYGVYYAILIVGPQSVFWIVAGLIIWRKPSDPMAVLTAFALVPFASITNEVSNPVPPGLPSFLVLPVQFLGLFGSYAIVAFFYLFPDGRLVVRWPLLVTAPQLVFQAAQFLAPSSVLNTGKVPHNPLASALLSGASLVTFFAMLMCVIYVQVYRYRNVSTALDRQQTKWVVYGASASITIFLIAGLTFAIPGFWSNALVQFIGNSIFAFVLVLLPLSIGFAVLRYRLWDVDVLINRTLVYGLLTASLAVVYVGSVVVLQALFRLLTGQGSGLAVAMSTLAIAALFQPLRHGIQALIDRRFYRRKYDAAQTLARFGERVRDDVNLDELTGDILSVVHETMGPSHVSLWLRPSGISEEAGA